MFYSTNELKEIINMHAHTYIYTHTYIYIFTYLLFCCSNIIVTIYRGEGSGTPLQYSCLENPMGGGA